MRVRRNGLRLLITVAWIPAAVLLQLPRRKLETVDQESANPAQSHRKYEWHVLVHVQLA